MSTERRCPQICQMAHMFAMNFRMAEMKDMLAERGLCMETQMHEMYSQIQSMSSALQKVKPNTIGSTVRDLLEQIERKLVGAKVC